MSRNVRVSLAGRDLVGLTQWNATSAAFYTLDLRFNVHATAHDPLPEKGFSTGAVHLKVEDPPVGSGGDAGAVAFMAPPSESWDHPMAELRNPVHVGSVIIPTDEENLSRFRLATKKHPTRLALPDRLAGKIVVVSGWLMPPDQYYVLQMASRDALAYVIESTATPWLVLSAALHDP